MKKRFCYLCSAVFAVILAASFSLAAFADEGVSSFVFFTVRDENKNAVKEYMCMQYEDKSSKCVIPATFNDCPVTWLNDTAFLGHNELTAVTLECDPLSIDYLNSNKHDYLHIFYAPNLQTITAAESCKKYSSQDGVLFSKDMTELCQFPAGKQSSYYVIPDTVTKLSPYAFENCQLYDLFIPSSVVSIGEYAFEGCKTPINVYYQSDGGILTEEYLRAFLPMTATVNLYEGDFPENDDPNYDPIVKYELIDSDPFAESREPDEEPFGFPEGINFDDLDSFDPNASEPENDLGELAKKLGSDVSSDDSRGIGGIFGSVLGALIFFADAVGIFMIAAVIITLRKNKSKNMTNGAVIPGASVKHITQPEAADYDIGAAAPEQSAEGVPSSAESEPTGEGAPAEEAPAPGPEVPAEETAEEKSEITAAESEDSAGTENEISVTVDTVAAQYDPASYTGSYGIPEGSIGTEDDISGAADAADTQYDPASYTGAYSGGSEYNVINEYIEGQPIDEPIITADPQSYSGVYSGGSSYNVVLDAPEEQNTAADPQDYTGSYALTGEAQELITPDDSDLYGEGNTDHSEITT